MNSSYLDDLSIALINQAEDDCAAYDPGMADAAAMVLVGDVYALRVCYGVAPPVDASSAPTALSKDEELSPFIR